MRKATANRSSQLIGSLLHDNSSPTTATQISLYLWYPLTTASTELKRHVTHGTELPPNASTLT